MRLFRKKKSPRRKLECEEVHEFVITKQEIDKYDSVMGAIRPHSLFVLRIEGCEYGIEERRDYPNGDTWVKVRFTPDPSW